LAKLVLVADHAVENNGAAQSGNGWSYLLLRWSASR
jgi:hypothetical protein